jgi:glycosyltransferase involved in cell wall biosynthesis
MKPSLCLNMIVKNEGARIERCLRSALPYVKAVSILDTGSTDDTVELIHAICQEFSVPATVMPGEFKNFSQARNEAFANARVHNNFQPWCQFALLMDADMELVVTDPDAFHKLDANALSYNMTQKGGAVSYLNRRVVNLNIGKPIYVGVTHEYVDVSPAASDLWPDGLIQGAGFIDHADGSNRANKYERDAELLIAALKDDPDNGRYLYYLGNTYADWEKPDLAIVSYDKRIALGGWDEETHSAMMRRADCLKAQPAEYVAGMLDAYNFRPQRLEPLYEIAKYYREKGDNAASLLFSKAGIDKKRPDDHLFVNDFVYDHGLRYEYSICGYYDDAERSRAFAVTDDLSLDPACPPDFRSSARNNLQHFTKPLSDYCPSFRPTKLVFTPPEGYTAMNPSVEECNGVLRVNIRCVNYRMDAQGRYMIGPKECNDAAIDTRNFVCRLTDDMRVFDPKEVLWHREKPAWDMVTGLEDIRLYRSRGLLWFSACVRELSARGVCQQVRGILMEDGGDPKYMLVAPNWTVMSDESTYEKNWMPMPHDGAQDFIYRLDTIRNPDTGDTQKFPVTICPDNISGSSQLVPFRGGWLAVVHEAVHGSDGLRRYWHRLAYFDKHGPIRRLSKPFHFFGRQIEFCAGLAYHPADKNLMVLSFGVKDAEAFVATASSEELAAFLWSHS